MMLFEQWLGKRIVFQERDKPYSLFSGKLKEIEESFISLDDVVEFLKERSFLRRVGLTVSTEEVASVGEYSTWIKRLEEVLQTGDGLYYERGCTVGHLNMAYPLIYSHNGEYSVRFYLYPHCIYARQNLTIIMPILDPDCQDLPHGDKLFRIPLSTSSIVKQ